MRRKTYNVTFARFGFAKIEAESVSEAMENANDLSDTDILWSDDIAATDAQESDE